MAVEHKKTFVVGGAVAEWSKALLLREKINENHKIPGLPHGQAIFKNRKEE